jgi:hypothetical protein
VPLRAATLQRAQRNSSFSGRSVTRRPSAHAEQQWGAASHTARCNSPCHTDRSAQSRAYGGSANSVGMCHALWGGHILLGKSPSRQLATARSSSNGVGGYSSGESHVYFDDDDYFFRDGLLADGTILEQGAEVVFCWSRAWFPGMLAIGTWHGMVCRLNMIM